MTLPTDRDARNAIPIWDGNIMYFPDVPAEVAKVSVAGQKQYGFDKLRWNREVSTDHHNKVIRHMLDDAMGEWLDSDGTFHLAKAVWRLSAALQLRIEQQRLKDSDEYIDKSVEPLLPALRAGAKVKVQSQSENEPPELLGTVVLRNEAEKSFTIERNDGGGWPSPSIGKGTYWVCCDSWLVEVLS